MSNGWTGKSLLKISSGAQYIVLEYNLAEGVFMEIVRFQLVMDKQPLAECKIGSEYQ